jgi:hypothetical protein
MLATVQVTHPNRVWVQLVWSELQGSAEDVIWTGYLSFRMSFVHLLVVCGAGNDP